MCVRADFEVNADVVGTVNILARGRDIVTRGEPVESDQCVE